MQTNPTTDDNEVDMTDFQMLGTPTTDEILVDIQDQAEKTESMIHEMRRLVLLAPANLARVKALSLLRQARFAIQDARLEYK